MLRSQHRVYDGSGEVARTQDVWGAEGISGRVKFLPLAWAGMPKTSFRKNSDSPFGVPILLERLINFEEDVLCFMTNANVPFTNNAAENSIRLTKVQQKISGCFRSTDGAKIFCRVKGYLATCRKQDVSATLAMTLVFEGKKLPDFAL